MARVQVGAEAFDQFTRLPRPIQERVRKLLIRLKDWPNVSGVKALSGNLAGFYRLRTGAYRVLFHAEYETGETVVVVDKIGHRRDFYED